MKNCFCFVIIILGTCLIGCRTSSLVGTQTGQVVKITDLGIASISEYIKLDNALLWQISNSSIDGFVTSYVFGTIHLIEKEKFFYPKGTIEALNNCKQVIFEIDMDNMNDMHNQFSMMTKMMMDDGITLDDLLAEEDYAFVSSFFNDLGVPMMFANRMKPMFLSSMTEIDVNDMNLFNNKGGEQSSVMSYEMELYNEAQERSIEVNGLETMDFQISIFDQIPYKDQAQMLVQVVRNVNSEESESMMKHLVDSYLNQDIESLVNTFTDDEGFIEFEKLLLSDRNAIWIPLMEAYMLQHSTFFAVGAGHLAGPQGVLHLLRTKGYTITPILYND